MSSISDFVRERGDLSKILLVSDLDGTLMNRENDISQENREAMQEFVDMGGRFAVCSGRVVASTEWLKVPMNTPSILHNGGSIYDFNEGKVVWTMPMEETVRDLLLDLQLHFPETAWTVYTAREHCVLHHNKWSDWLSGIEGCKPSRINCKLEDVTDPILKFVTPGSPEEIAKVMAYIHDNCDPEVGTLFPGNVSLPTLLEFTGANSDKGAALQALAEICHVELSDIIYMGDNMNDYNALKIAGLSVVPESCHQGVRQLGDYIGVDMDEHLMVDVLNEIKKGLMGKK
ncbi:MAG: HAD-IIB family hydrolase [Eubacterium sp.]|nr:HAD-IIB family hydrolase [Eubacterium sp.]